MNIAPVVCNVYVPWFAFEWRQKAIGIQWKYRNCTSGDMGEHSVLSVPLGCKSHFPKWLWYLQAILLPLHWRAQSHWALQSKQASYVRTVLQLSIHLSCPDLWLFLLLNAAVLRAFMGVSPRALESVLGLIPTRLSPSISEVPSEAEAIATMCCTLPPPLPPACVYRSVLLVWGIRPSNRTIWGDM